MRGSERFTQRASTAITKAHDAALGMGHSYVGTEHLLLGIIREGEGLLFHFLKAWSLSIWWDMCLVYMITCGLSFGESALPLSIISSITFCISKFRL